MNWIFCDLDCTLIDTKELVISGGPEPEVGTKEHEEWVNHVTKPEIIEAANPVASMLQLIYSLNHSKNTSIAFITNRRSSMSEITLNWLKRYNIYSFLIMRPIDENTRAGEFKEKKIKQLLTEGDTCIVIDDDPDGSVEAACKRNSWTHLKVTHY